MDQAHVVTKFASWWLYLWGIVALGLIASLFLIPFRWWVVITVFSFGTMEGIGLFAGDFRLPPLTLVIQAYLSPWISLPAMWALAAGAGAKWFGWSHPLGVSLLAGLVCWINVHFDETYGV